MPSSMNRRNWIRTSALIASGATVGAGLVSNTALGAPFPHRVLERNAIKPEELPKLKARLLANENPFGPSASTQKAIMDAVSTGNRYGHQQAHDLMEQIAEKEGVTKDHIMMGPGSTDLLEKTAIVTCMKGGNVVAAHPSYMSLINTAEKMGASWKSIPLTRDHAHDLDGMEAAVDRNTKLVYVCNPNNPTGSLTDANKLGKFCRSVSKKTPIFVDEAYMEFLFDDMQSSMVNLVKEGEDVIISRTFSKIHGMAGLRVGYIVAKPERIAALNSMVRGTMGLCVTSLMGAQASLKDTDFHQMTREKTREAREFTFQALKSMDMDYIPSHTSFVIFPLSMPGQKYRQKMMDRGVGIRVYDIDGKPWGRVSMGTMEEMKLFADATKQVISKVSSLD